MTASHQKWKLTLCVHYVHIVFTICTMFTMCAVQCVFTMHTLCPPYALCSPCAACAAQRRSSCVPTSGACDPHTAHSYSSNSSTSLYTICNTGHTCLLTTGASSADHGSVLGAEAPRVSHPLWPNHQLPVCQSTVGQTHLKHGRANTQALQTQGAASSYSCVTSRRIIQQAQNYYSTHQRANTEQMHKSIKEDGLVN